MSLPLDSSLQGLRESVYSRLSTKPQAAAEVEVWVNRHINKAIEQVALDMPYYAHETYVRLWTDFEYESVDATDTIELVTDDEGLDEHTFKRTLAVASIDAEDVLPIDRSLDGAYIQFTDGRGVVHTNQIRSVWTSPSSGSPQYQYISLMRPYIGRQDRSAGNVTVDDGPFEWRIFHPYLWLPDEIIQIKSMRLTGRGGQPLQVISQDQAEAAGLDDINFAQSASVPAYVYRRGHFRLPGFAAAPVVTASNTGASAVFGDGRFWRGPEPYGAFEYIATVTYGKDDYDSATGARATWQSGADTYLEGSSYSSLTIDQQAAAWADNRRRRPRFESAPSPASTSITVADPGTGNQSPANVIQVPNLSYQSGFLFTGFDGALSSFSRLADTHSGMHVRIYRRRVSTQIGAGYESLKTETDSQNISNLSMLDDDDAFYLLAEFRIDAANGGRFVDDGYILPDKSVRLREVHGYQAMRMHPVPDDRYEIEARVIRKPPLLINDSDVPEVDPVANEAIVLLAAAYEQERRNNPADADRLRRLYREQINTLGRRFGTVRPANQPARMIPVSARNRRRFRRGLWTESG